MPIAKEIGGSENWFKSIMLYLKQFQKCEFQNIWIMESGYGINTFY